MKDPYLIPGQPCECWDTYYRGRPCYGEFKNFSGTGRIVFRRVYADIIFDHYRPIGTEWDFAPDWAICSTVDSDRVIHLWKTIPKPLNKFWDATGEIMICGICPDLSRWQGDAWKTSLRMRPAWAREE